jgi:uncharacterized damage-inducible protein DinB
MLNSKAEPWLRGTHTDLLAVPRAVVHALELAAEDLQIWCGQLSDEEVNTNPANLPSVAFQLRHISRSIDRLLTYAEGHALRSEQLAALRCESDSGASCDGLFAELQAALTNGIQRVRVLGRDAANFEQIRAVGRQNIPTTVGGLLIHIADHTQRHVGQAITTAKLLRSQRAGG